MDVVYFEINHRNGLIYILTYKLIKNNMTLFLTKNMLPCNLLSNYVSITFLELILLLIILLVIFVLFSNIYSICQFNTIWVDRSEREMLNLT